MRRLSLSSSTGVIGTPFPIQEDRRRDSRIDRRPLSGGWMRTVEAIMTTDTFPKVEVATCRIKGGEVKLCGMVKGAGMIRPNLASGHATMLSFLVTDADIKASASSTDAGDSRRRIPTTGSRSTGRQAPMIPFCSWPTERRAIPLWIGWTGMEKSFNRCFRRSAGIWPEAW